MGLGWPFGGPGTLKHSIELLQTVLGLGFFWGGLGP